MATYNTKLKRSKDGRIFRNCGWDKKGQQVKFSLGFDMDAAEKRLELILALWEANCQRSLHSSASPSSAMEAMTWGPDHLKAAKAIAKGKTPQLPASIRAIKDPQAYLQDLREISDATHTAWEAQDQSLQQKGKARAKASLSEVRKNLSQSSEIEATGITFEDAVSKFTDFLHTEFLMPNGKLKPNGKKLIDQAKGFSRLLKESFRIEGGKRVERNLLDLDLAQLDFAACQEAYDCIRKRPLSHRSGKTQRLAWDSATNMVKCLTRFFDWLDLSDLDWREPPKFRKLNKKVDPLSAEEKFRKGQRKEQSIIPIDQLGIIAQYCRPEERVYFLLGLNCAFGEGEAGQLRIPFIKGREIDGIRFKTGNATKHHLWDETADALQGIIKTRPVIKDDIDQIVFVTEQGTPIWHTTEKGNYSNGISNRWNAVMKRVQKDHPEIPSYSFNKLRKTAATNILRLCSAESASMLLAHKTISDDELLECYVSIPWEKLFEAQRKWGEEILPKIQPNPLHINVGGGGLTVKQVAKVKELHDQGMSRARIAKELGITWMTANRTVKSFYADQPRAGS